MSTTINSNKQQAGVPGHAIVTGGASGIGAACAANLSEDGWQVTSFDLAPAREPLPDVTYEIVDVSDAAAVRSAVERAASRQPITGLINAAGVRGGAETQTAVERESARASLSAAERRGVSLRAFELIDTAAFERMLRVHLLGTFNTMQAVLPSMLDRSNGSIVNIASICGILGCEVTPHYSAAKAGVIGLTRSLVRDVSRSSIRINVVAPGFIKTPMMGTMDNARAEALFDQIPMGRFGEAAEVASLATYLLGPNSTYITGEVISPSGGQAM